MKVLTRSRETEIPERALSVSKSPAGSRVLLDGDVVSAPTRARATASTMVV